MNPVPENPRMTPVRQQVLDFFRERQRAGLPPPSVREIAAKQGWASTNAAMDVLRVLEKLGKVRQACGKHRSRGWVLHDADGLTQAAPIAPISPETATAAQRDPVMRWIAEVNRELVRRQRFVTDVPADIAVVLTDLYRVAGWSVILKRPLVATRDLTLQLHFTEEEQKP